MPLERTPRRRLAAAVLLVAVVGAGLAVHSLLPDTAATDIAGDALYAVAVYLAVAIAAPGLRPLAIGAITAAWSVAVELFQLTGIPLALGAVFAPSMLVLGTVFDARDLLVYVIAAAVICGADVAWPRPSIREDGCRSLTTRAESSVRIASAAAHGPRSALGRGRHDPGASVRRLQSS